MEFEPQHSKSRLKRELLALQDFGRELVELPEKNLVKLPLSEPLLVAIREARSMKRGARQRQIRHIGGLLSHADVEPIRHTLRDLLQPTVDDARAFREIEQWRDRLLEGGEDAIGEFIAHRPDAERQKLRRLVRNANKELQESGPPKSARLLFKYLRDL